MRRFTLYILFALSFAGCNDPTGTARDRAFVHSGAVSTATWRPGDRPHVLTDSVVVTTSLTIQPGTVICGAPDARLVIGPGAHLSALGTAAQPITFTACDPTLAWAGIRVGGFHFSEGGGTAELAHVNIEFANTGVYTGGGSTVEIDSSRFRRAGLFTAVSYSTTHLRNSIIDSGDVRISNGTYQNSVIRVGRLQLISDRFQPGITIDGGRIENSPETALSALSTAGGTPPVVTGGRPLRIVGSQGKAVSIPLQAFAEIWPTRAAQDSLLGNGNDTLEIWSGSTHRHIYVRSDLPWNVTFGHFSAALMPLFVDSLTVEAGATLLLKVNGIEARGGVHAEGTAQRPIKVIGFFGEPYFSFTDTAQSKVTHVVFSNVRLQTFTQHSVIFDHIQTDAQVNFFAPGSRLLQSRIRNVVRAEGPNSPAVRIYADNVQLSNCEVSDNVGDGVWIFQGNAQFPYAARDVRINDCNIERNGGLGVNNANSSMIDARRNWWGDPAGPLGPNGDGVSGNVDYSEQRASPMFAPKYYISRGFIK